MDRIGRPLTLLLHQLDLGVARKQVIIACRPSLFHWVQVNQLPCPDAAMSVAVSNCLDDKAPDRKRVQLLNS